MNKRYLWLLFFITGFTAEDQPLRLKRAAALATFSVLKDDLPETLCKCISGRELEDRGFEADIGLAGVLNVGKLVPVLKDRAFRAAQDM
jgi:2-phosphosulfolactate phosphatase